MRVGVFTPLLSQLPLESVLKKLTTLNINTVELATGNYVGDAHCKLSMLDNSSALSDFKKTLADHGFSISSLSCHGNPLHPDKAIAQQHRDVSRKTILLAEKLGVPVMVDFSGCPGDSPNAIAPNWITCPWPPDFLNGARLAVERGCCAFLGRTRKVCRRSWRQNRGGDAPRDLWCTTQRRCSDSDPLQDRMSAATSTPAISFGKTSIPSKPFVFFGDSVFHAHAKDTQLYTTNLHRTGVLDTKPYTKSAIGAGSSALAAMVMASSSGAS